MAGKKISELDTLSRDLDRLSAFEVVVDGVNYQTELGQITDYVRWGDSIILPVGDETTPIVSATGVFTFRMPYAFYITSVRASLTTAQASGSIFTVDINRNGVSILSPELTIDNTEKSSTTALVSAVVVQAVLDDENTITIDVDQIGDGTATGLKIYLIGYRYSYRDPD